MYDAGFRHLNSVMDLGMRHIKVYLQNRLDANASPRTMANQLAHLRGMLRHAGNRQIYDRIKIPNTELGIPPSKRLGSKIPMSEIEFSAVVESIACKNLKVILELERALGLRAMEAIRAGQSLRGWQTQISSGSDSIDVVYGTKGGRVRCTRIPDSQRALTAINSSIAIMEHGRLAPRRTLKEAVCWYRNSTHRLGVQGHRLRYAFAQDCVNSYLLSGMSAREAYARTSMDLGHGDGRGRWVKMVYCQNKISEIL